MPTSSLESSSLFEAPPLPSHRPDTAAIERAATNISWLNFWAAAWFGATLAGGLFGAAIGLTGLWEGNWVAIPACGFMGILWAGIAGLIAIPHVALLKWMFWIRCSPRMLAGLAGGLAGCLTPFLPLTAPLGAFGAVLCVKKFMKTRSAAVVCEYERLRIEEYGMPRQRTYSIKDLFLRITALAVLITVWKVVLT